MAGLNASLFVQTLIECYQIANYTGIFLNRDEQFKTLTSCIKTAHNGDVVDTCNDINAHFVREFLNHYLGCATLRSVYDPDLSPNTYKVVQEGERDGLVLKTHVIESDTIGDLKITFKYGEGPTIHVYHLDSNYVYWKMSLGLGYAEKFNSNYCGSVIDGIIEGANG